MGLRDRLKRTTSSLEELHTDRLKQRFGSLSTQPIAGCPLRVRVRLGGEVQRMRMVPRAGSPTFEVTISDGSGEAIAIFTGRRSLAAMEHGTGVIIEGVAHLEHGRPVLLNPAYTLLPKN